MKKKSKVYHSVACLLLGMFVFALSGQLAVIAQEVEVEADGQGTALIIEPEEVSQKVETVTINVKDANISEVLKAYSLQTGQSIVVGPDVVSDNVNVRLNNIPWQEALDVILKPYGFGYRQVGDTIVISKLENIVQVEGIEPLASKVFNLLYLDAYDIKEVCEAQLSARGKFTILSSKGLPGWEFGGSGSGRSSGSGGAATEAGIRSRKEREQIQKSKTFIITDVPASLTGVSEIIEEMDIMPTQVLIEAKFLEINTGALSDIGLDYIGAMENVEELSLSTGSSGSTLQPTALSELNKILNPTTGFPDPLQMGASGGLSQESGLRLAHTQLGDSGFEVLFALMAKDDDVNILSSPRILTLNNQEAAILVGTKYPIIESSSNAGGGFSSTTSTSLDYYENIGIQLNVIPQVCDNGYVNMIVHPAVSEIKGFESGVVFSGGESASGTQYPVLSVREAETQVMIQSGNTAAIGGLQTERDQEYIEKIPFLGDIPFLGRLFRREKMTKEKIDLLIFIKASIIDDTAYAAESLEKEQAREAVMRLELVEEAEEDVNDFEEPVAEAVEIEELSEVEVEPADETVVVTEQEEIVAFVSGAAATNDVTADVESEKM
jgi:type IV pilus assembly protein PilQ